MTDAPDKTCAACPTCEGCDNWLERETAAAFEEVKGLPKWALLASRFEPFRRACHGTGKREDQRDG